MLLRPDQSVNNLRGDLSNIKERSLISCIDEVARYEVSTVTFLSGAATAQGDYFTFANKAGATFAVWIDIDANGTPPSGAAYTAATTKISAGIASTDTALQAVVKIASAIGANFTNVTVLNNLNGSITFTQNLIGVTTDPVPHNTGDTGAGTIVVLVNTQGVTSVLQNKYFVLHSALDAALYHVWANVGTEGIDPNPGGGSVAIVAAIPANSSAAAVAVLFSAAVDAHAAFVSKVDNAGTFYVLNAADGNSTNIGAGNIGFAVSVASDGYIGSYGPATAVDSLLVSPLTIV